MNSISVLRSRLGAVVSLLSQHCFSTLCFDIQLWAHSFVKWRVVNAKTSEWPSSRPFSTAYPVWLTVAAGLAAYQMLLLGDPEPELPWGQVLLHVHQVHLWTLLCSNMVFIMVNPWLAQKSNNKAHLGIRSDGLFFPITPLQVTPHHPRGRNYGVSRLNPFQDTPRDSKMARYSELLFDA